MVRIIRVSNRPALPTNGSPWSSSSAPGASPMNMSCALMSPTPKTTFLRAATRLAPAIGQTSGRWGRSKYSQSELRWQIQAKQLTYAGASELQPSGVVFARYAAVAMKAHRLNEGRREDMAYCGDDPQLGVGWGREPGAVQGTAPLRTRPSLQAVDEAGNVAGAEAVIDVYHRDIAGTTVEHAEQGGEAVEARAIADAGGDGDHRAGNHAAHHAGKRTLHAGADHDDAGLGEALAVAHEAVDAGHPDIVDGVDFIAHQFRGDPGFFGHRHIAGAGADHTDAAFAINGAVAPKTDGAGEVRILGAGQLGGDGCGANGVGAGDQNIARILQQASGDGNHLIGGLALGRSEEH